MSQEIEKKVLYLHKSTVSTARAYNSLTRSKQNEAREKITEECQIDLRKFYRWLKDPRLIRRPDQKIFAKAFGVPVEILFPTKSARRRVHKKSSK